MTGSGRITRIGKVLAAGALIGLAGCQQVPPRPTTSSPLGWGNNSKGGEPTITPAQEADVQISMGRAAEQQGDLEQAMAAYRAALSRDQRRADAYARMAVLNDKQGKFRESAELYRKALTVRPGDPDIFCDMGYSFYLQRRWAEAEMNLRQSIAINRDHRRAHNNLALLLVRDNRLDAALAEFRKAGNDPVQAHMNLAFALTTDQRWESARAEYERALAIDPSCQLAKARLDQLNTLVARRESPEGAQRDQETLATATAAPLAQRQPDRPTAAPRQFAPSAAPPDPAVLTTAAVVSSSSAQRYRPMERVAIQPLLVENGAMARLWSSAAGPGTAAPPHLPDATARPAPTVRRDAQPQLAAAAPSDNSSSLPLPAIHSSRTAPPYTRHPIPPPRPFTNPAPVAADPTPKSTNSTLAERE